jgi:murein L,D-transpeptidase YafK
MIARRALLACVALAPFAPAHAQPAPTSQRARAAERRVTPILQRALEAQGLRLGAPVFIRIFKEPAILEVWLRTQSGQYSKFKDYPICAFSGRLGPKLREGDLQAPEGFYAVAPNQMNPHSQFHLSFNMGFPNAYDRHHGRSGSFLMVHGACVSIGCYAMTDAGIEDIWTLMNAAFRAGLVRVPVHAFPFPLTTENIARRGDVRLNAWIAQLQEGYDAFERTRIPPRIIVRGGRYVLR